VSSDVFEHLDHREKNGYLREFIDITFADGATVTGLVYIGYQDSPAYVETDSIADIAKTIFDSVGPSGANKDYVYQLSTALREHNEHDDHVFAIEQQLLTLENS
jgi:cation transport regulator ChaC